MSDDEVIKKWVERPKLKLDMARAPNTPEGEAPTTPEPPEVEAPMTPPECACCS